jgi:flagellar basal body rod protein FlgG
MRKTGILNEQALFERQFGGNITLQDNTMEISTSSALSGIQTYMQRQNVSANDVANINTPGYEQQRVEQAEQTPYGVEITGISRVPNYSADQSNTDYAEEAGEMIMNKTGTAAESKVIRTQDRMTGELLDLIG